MKDRVLNVPLDRLKPLLDGIHQWVFLPPRAERREVRVGDVFYVWETPVLLMVCEVVDLSREDLHDFPWWETRHPEKASLWAALDAFAKNGETPPDTCQALRVHAQTLFTRGALLRAVVATTSEGLHGFLPVPLMYAWLGDLGSEPGRTLLEWRETPEGIVQTRRPMKEEEEPLKPAMTAVWCRAGEKAWIGELP